MGKMVALVLGVTALVLLAIGCVMVVSALWLGTWNILEKIADRKRIRRLEKDTK